MDLTPRGPSTTAIHTHTFIKMTTSTKYNISPLFHFCPSGLPLFQALIIQKAAAIYTVKWRGSARGFSYSWTAARLLEDGDGGGDWRGKVVWGWTRWGRGARGLVGEENVKLVEGKREGVQGKEMSESGGGLVDSDGRLGRMWRKVQKRWGWAVKGGRDQSAFNRLLGIKVGERASGEVKGGEQGGGFPLDMEINVLSIRNSFVKLNN